MLRTPFLEHDEVDHVDALAVTRAVRREAVDRCGVELHRGGLVVVEGATQHAVAVGGEAVVTQDGLDAKSVFNGGDLHKC